MAWLLARSAGARFLVRLEDLDAARVRPGAAAGQLADLARLGLDWDGEVVVQSEHTGLYDEALAGLAGQGLVYECFCTRAEIREAASAPHGPPGAYPGTCARLTAAERAQRLRAGRPPALRLRAGDVRIAFEDLVQGPGDGRVDDFVLRRNDGVAAYNLAVVVDDCAQGVGEIVRGCDLLDSTPRQLLLARLLGRHEPAHAHVGLARGPDGARLAKRHGAVTLAALQAAGVGPDAVLDGFAQALGLGESGERTGAPALVARVERGRLLAAARADWVPEAVSAGRSPG